LALTNYHSHTKFCDGKSPHEEYVVEALKHGLVAYGFSSHAPVPYPSDWNMNMEDVPEYLSIIDGLKAKYKGQIQLYKGLEVDYIPGKTGPGSKFIRSLNLDYTIGAIHYMDEQNGKGWDVDGPQKVFDEGMEKIYRNDVKAFLRNHFGRMRQMLKEEPPDILAHIDKIKTKNPGEKYWSLMDDFYLDQIEQTLNLVKKQDVVMEINSRGVYKGTYPDFYPNDTVLKMASDKKIKVMVNADVHKPVETGKGYGEAYQALKNAGFHKVTVLIDNQWKDFDFDSRGIIIH
jgi:histidinol-phosphatase (PHP family)